MLQNKAFGTFIAAMLLFPSAAVGQSSRKSLDTQKGSKAKVVKLICVKSGDLYGYIDLKGVFVINPQFQPAHPFDRTSGLAIVRFGGKFGFIDRNGKYVINPQFESVQEFDAGGYAPAKLGGKWGYIDRTGKWLINPQFDWAWGLYKLNRWGWWLIFIALCAFFISNILTYAWHDVTELYRLMNYPKAQIAMIQNSGFFRGNSMMWVSLFYTLPFMGYLIFIKRFFRRKS